MGVEVPHFAQAFTIGEDGAAVVEQDSTADKAACVYRVAACLQKYREDLPEFGIPQLLRKALPPDLAALEDAISAWEPRATLTVTEQVEALNAALTIEIDVT